MPNVATQRHPSFGVVPPEKFKEAERAPFGGATRILRQYDPLFGLLKAGERTEKFRLECSQRVRIRQYAIVEIEAVSKEQAEEPVSSLPDSAFAWDDDGTDADYADEFEIEEIKEIEA